MRKAVAEPANILILEYNNYEVQSNTIVVPVTCPHLVGIGRRSVYTRHYPASRHRDVELALG